MTAHRARLGAAPRPAAGRAPRVVSSTEALRSVVAGTRVVSSPYCATPTTLLSALAARSHATPGVVLSAGMLLGDMAYLDEVVEGRMIFRTWHIAGRGRRLAGSDYLEYVPVRARDVAAHLRSRVDVAIVRVTPPDAHGMCSLGPSASYTKAMLMSARLTIAEVDPQLPRTRGSDVSFPYASFDLVVDAETPTSTYVSGHRSEQAAQIAKHLVPLIKQGATLQLGIGSVTEEVASSLVSSDVSDLRIVGMMTDSMVDLAESGRLVHGPNSIEAVELLGTRKVFDFAYENDAVQMYSSATIHDSAWLASKPNLISICSALSVDLSGQVASEQIGPRLISGVGGSADFFEGAHQSPGGARVVALTAKTPSGASRICAELAPGTAVTLPRHSIDYVVTEHGAAHLAGLSLGERAEALTAIAAPEHRDALEASLPRRKAEKGSHHVGP